MRTRLALAKNKDGPYKPDETIPPAGEGRPELGVKAAKAAKAMGPPAERLASSIDLCLADAKVHAARREEKAAERWKEHFSKVDVKIDILKSSAAVASEAAAATKRREDLAFLMGGNTAVMSPEVLAWYLPQARAILASAPPVITPTATPSSTPRSEERRVGKECLL